MLPNGRTIVERIIHAEPIAAGTHHARATRTRPSLAGAVSAEHASGGRSPVATRRRRSLLGALRTATDKATVLAGLQRCEVLGLWMADVRSGNGACSSLRARAVTRG
jgi:hypothetical protein